MALVRPHMVMMNILAGTFLFNVFICSVQRGVEIIFSPYMALVRPHGDYEYPSR